MSARRLSIADPAAPQIRLHCPEHVPATIRERVPTGGVGLDQALPELVRR